MTQQAQLFEHVLPPASGLVHPCLRSRATGAEILLTPTKNVVVYTAADLLARVLAGDATYLPKHVGFIYGTVPSPALDDPETLSLNVKRAHDWAKIATDVAAIGGNMLVAPLSLTPSISLDGDSSRYSGNAVTFSAHTGLVEEYAFSTLGGTFASTLDDLDDDYSQSVYIYHVVLLNRWRSGSTVTYTPFSRAALESAPFTAKPASFDMGVYWTITFR